MNKLSIIIPTYDEERTVDKLINKVDKIKYPCYYEIIVVNDGSKDHTYEKEKVVQHKDKKHIKIISYNKNRGKGYAIRTGLKHAKGDIFIVQDADLEYDPKQIPKLIMPILKEKTEVVYGSRFLKINNSNWKIPTHYIGNKLLTQLTNLLYFSKLTDMETCYKAFTKKVKDSFSLTTDRFGFEVEITAKICKNKFKIIELPIDYKPRDWTEGKKISWKDGIQAAWYLIKFRIVN
jgi:glycosyltransferase involved in cell wall biosynthesis